MKEDGQDPKPQRPLSAYLQFKQEREQHQDHCDNPTRAKKIKLQWDNLPPLQKEQKNEANKQADQNYLQQLEAWKKRHDKRPEQKKPERKEEEKEITKPEKEKGVPKKLTETMGNKVEAPEEKSLKAKGEKAALKVEVKGLPEKKEGLKSKGKSEMPSVVTEKSKEKTELAKGRNLRSRK